MLDSDFLDRMASNRGMHLLPDSYLQDVAIPEANKEFLRTIGLPKGEIGLISFAPESYGLRLPFETELTKPELIECFEDWLIVGGNDFELIALNLADNATIWSIGTTDRGLLRFINTSVRTLVFSLAAYAEYMDSCFDEMTDDEVDQIISLFKNRLTSIDDRCLSNPNHFWSLIVEQMDNDML